MQQRKTKLLKVLDLLGYKRNNIICIYQEGSSLYVKNPHDIDYKVIVHHYNPKAKHHLDFDIYNKRSQATIYTLYDWNNIYKYKKDCLFIAKGMDMKKIYGNDSELTRYDIITNKKFAKLVIEAYDKCLFNYVSANSIYGYPMMNERRLYDFLVFAYKIKNNSQKLTRKQLKEINMVHDMENPNIEEYRPLFNEISALLHKKGEIINE